MLPPPANGVARDQLAGPTSSYTRFAATAVLKFKDQEWATVTEMVMVADDGKSRVLAMIDARKVKPEICEKANTAGCSFSCHLLRGN